MIRLLVVGDGPRDEVTLPRLVEKILGARVDEVSRTWPRLQGGGLKKKLRFATLDANDSRAQGIVAVVDLDKSGSTEKLKKLQASRDALRIDHPPFPIALGCARPHGEAWLFDDGVAVRNALQLEGSTAVPPITKLVDSPKKALEDLLSSSPRAGALPLDVWADIANQLEPGRCTHEKETGFRAFRRELDQEIAPLVEGCGCRQARPR